MERKYCDGECEVGGDYLRAGSIFGKVSWALLATNKSWDTVNVVFAEGSRCPFCHLELRADPVLKPCPISGHQVSEFHINKYENAIGDVFRLECPCGVSGQFAASIDGAIMTWNAMPRHDDYVKVNGTTMCGSGKCAQAYVRKEDS